MSNDIRNIIERLAILEGRITSTTVKHGLNPQQKEVPQLPALFKPKHISVLKSKTDPKHPMSGYMVGDSVEHKEEMIDESHMSNIDQIMQDIGTGEIDIYDIYANPQTPEEEYASKIVNRMYDDVTIDRGLHPDDDAEDILEIVADQIAQDFPTDEINESLANEEKILAKVRKSLVDYLANTQDKYKDANLKDKIKIDRDLGKKDKSDKDLLPKHIDEDTTQFDPVQQDVTTPEINPTYSGGQIPTDESIDIGGKICEIHGNPHSGFEIRHGNRSLKTRFKTIEEARLALEMFMAHRRRNNKSADYIEEK